MSDRNDRPGGPDVLVDALADLVLDDDSAEFAAEAAAAGEDVAADAARLRERFLDRVAAAQAREPGPERFAGRRDDGLAAERVEEELVVPSAIGRYPVLRRLGAGGMGVVYGAYDETLDRRIAIKVLHPRAADIDGRRRERLLREAQAMARVTHPNVITVHEVGTEGGQIFVAMEFVAGPTVEEWLDAEVRGWREIVAIFRQAAEGLAALHDAGLIHRDVKPSNMIIGEDGRVRVLDLGLVGAEPREFNETLEVLPPLSSSVNRLSTPLTTTGERVGTPAYMSREQFLNLELTPASDIFSLCIVLYEALHGVHPFMAETFSLLQANVLAGRIRGPIDPGAVPSWLHAVVVRGLAKDPAERPASMRELSEALANEPHRRLRRWVGTIGIAAVATLVGVGVTRSQVAPAVPSCDGGVVMLAPVWGTAQAEAIERAMVASGSVYASGLSERVISELGAYAAAWIDAHGRACREHVRGDYSDALLDTRIACLERRRQALDETVTILSEADTAVVENAGQMVAKLPSLSPCDDVEALATGRPPPEDPRIAAAVTELELRLVRAEAKAYAGQTEDAVAVAQEIAAAAGVLEHPATVAAALLTEARAMLSGLGEPPEIHDLLSRTLSLAISENLDLVAAEAMSRRLYVRGLRQGRSEIALDDLPIAEAMLERAGNPPELRALLINNSGAIRLSAGDREGAREAFAEALEVKERVVGRDHLDNAAMLANLGMLTSSADAREALHARMIELYESHLGPLHPQTLDGRFLVAMYTADPGAAAVQLRDLQRTFTELGEARQASESALELGRIEHALGDPKAAREAFESARVADDWRRGVLIDGYVALAGGGDRTRAIDALRALIGDGEESGDANTWWLRIVQAERRALLARLLAAVDSPPAVRVEVAQAALADVEAIAGEAQPIERERLLATCRRVLAEALHARGDAGDEPRARELEAAAHAHYLRWPDAYRHYLPTTPRPGARR